MKSQESLQERTDMIDDRIVGDIEETLKNNTKSWSCLGDKKKMRES